MTFGLNMTAQAAQLREAASRPMGALEPGFFEGAVSAPLSGLARGLVAKPALFVSEALTPRLKPLAKSIDEMFGTDTQSFLDDELRKTRDFLKDTTPDGQTTGMGGQILHSLFDIGGSALTMGPVATGVLEGYALSREAEERGVDRATAQAHGLAQAAAVTAGTALPLSLGVRRAPDLLYAAAAAAVPNAAGRGVSHEVLARAGYKEMAKQYQMLDAQAIAADVVLGVFFGGVSRLARGAEKNAQQRIEAKARPTDVGAALSAKAAHHLELDTAPGVPRTVEARQAHVEAAVKATEDLLVGRAVDVGPKVLEAEFQRDPAKEAHAKLVESSVREHIGEAYDRVLSQPFGPVDDPLVRITSKELGDVLLERGPALPGKGELEVRPGGFGLVKILWKHGEKSKKAPETQVTREDVLRLPEVVRDYLPIEDRVQADGKRLIEWQLERQDGKRVIYSARRFAEGGKESHVVTVFVNSETGKMKAKPLSEMRNRLNPESPTAESMSGVRDTGRGPLLSSRGGQGGGSEGTVAPRRAPAKGVEAESPEVALAREALKENPDLVIVDENGQQVKASELLKSADEARAKAETDAKGFEAAVNCFLRTGS